MAESPQELAAVVREYIDFHTARVVLDFDKGKAVKREEAVAALDGLLEQYEGVLTQLTAGRESEAELRAEWVSMKEQLEALREAVRKGLDYAEACESWPSTPSEKEHYRQEVESMRAALNPARES